MKILVTGANGFFAANIIEELNRRGYSIKAMMRSNADSRAMKNLKYEVQYGEITIFNDVIKAVKGMDIVIHAAASTAQSQTHYKEIMKVNYTGTKNVVDACINEKVKRLIYISTANTLCNGTKENPGTEKMPISPLFSRSFYARSKLIAQQYVIKNVQQNELDAVIVNPAFMLGPRDSKPSSGQIILMYFRKKVAFVTKGGKSFIHVKDAAEGICNAISYGIKGECYLLANQNLSYKEFVQALNNVDGHKNTIITVPTFILKFIGIFGDILTYFKFSVKFNSINMQILETGNYYSSTKAINQLKMKQTPVEIAIKDAIQWFSENGLLKK